MLFENRASHTVKQHNDDVFVAFCKQLVKVFERAVRIRRAETFQHRTSQRHERIVVVDGNRFIHTSPLKYYSYILA